jgi:flagellar protein FlbD
MIKLIQPNGREFFLNEDLIETIQEVPHTVIYTKDENRYLVKETGEEIVDKIIEFRKKIFTNPHILKEGE